MLDPQKLRRFDPPMTGDDAALIVDQNRICPAEGLDAFGDLADLFFLMDARIVRIRRERVDAAIFDSLITHGYASTMTKEASHCSHKSGAGYYYFARR